jgi:hypothetical protein
MSYNGQLGIWVSRAAVNLPAGAGTNDLFVVTGGAVVITGAIGRITTQFGAGPANIRLRHLVGAVVTLGCLYTAAQGLLVGVRFWYTGIDQDYLQILDPAVGNGASGACPGIFGGWVVLPGTIQLETDANMTGGATAWEAFYVPLEAGATMASA